MHSSPQSNAHGSHSHSEGVRHHHASGSFFKRDLGSHLMMLGSILTHGDTSKVGNYRKESLIVVPHHVIVLSVLGLVLAAILWAVLPAQFTLTAVILGVVAGAFLVIPLALSIIFRLVVGAMRTKARSIVIGSVVWRGDEQVLDVACGSGMLLNGCAQKLTTGKATGIDIWRKNAAGGTYKDLIENAEAEGVSGRIEFQEMDARHMTFDNARFDVAVSSFALHHIGDTPAETEQALKEIIRVLKPGGRVSLIDIAPMIETAERVLAHSGMQSVQRQKVALFSFVTATKA